MPSATWSNGKRAVSGTWDYYWAGDYFSITLASKDRVTGEQRSFRVYGDSPEWGKWKLDRALSQSPDPSSSIGDR